MTTTSVQTRKMLLAGICSLILTVDHAAAVANPCFNSVIM